MAKLPVRLIEKATLVERRAAKDWWAGLSEVSRAELAILLDPRTESCAFAFEVNDDGVGQWQSLPVCVNSELLAEPEEPDTDWYGAYMEYRIINPEIYRVPQYEYQPFLIGGFGTISFGGLASVPGLFGI